jgi:hypothetical protein
LALTQASNTWSAVALSRRAISLTGLSTGPPGRCVIGLLFDSHERCIAQVARSDKQKQKKERGNAGFEVR